MKIFGSASIFYMSAGFCVLAILFVSRFVPKTKGFTFEEIESNLKKGVSLRHLGRRLRYPKRSITLLMGIKPFQPYAIIPLQSFVIFHHICHNIR